VSRDSKWQGHDWMQTTWRREYAYWRCRGCGTKIRRRDPMQMKWAPSAFELSMDIRPLTCEEIQVKQVMES